MSLRLLMGPLSLDTLLSHTLLTTHTKVYLTSYTQINKLAISSFFSAHIKHTTRYCPCLKLFSSRLNSSGFSRLLNASSPTVRGNRGLCLRLASARAVYLCKRRWVGTILLRVEILQSTLHLITAVSPCPCTAHTHTHTFLHSWVQSPLAAAS